jgi:hypothetical protein
MAGSGFYQGVHFGHIFERMMAIYDENDHFYGKVRHFRLMSIHVTAMWAPRAYAVPCSVSQ